MCIHPREFILAYGFTSVLYVCVFGTECIALVGVVCAHEPTSMHHVQRIRMLQKRCVCSFKLVLLTSDARDNDDWCDRILRHQCLVASRAIVAKTGSRSAATSLKLATTTI